MLNFNHITTGEKRAGQRNDSERDEIRAELIARMESVLTTMFPRQESSVGQVPDRRHPGQPGRQP